MEFLEGTCLTGGMTRTSLRDVTCSIARTVDVLGDAWAWLIIRDVFLGVHRFDDLCADLGVSRKVLTERLRQLTDSGILTRDVGGGSDDVATRAARRSPSGYRLTEKGEGLVPILAAFVAWGDRWEPTPAGPPMYLEHDGCASITAEVTCSRCGELLTAHTLVAHPGPGGSAGRGTALLGSYLRPADRPEAGPVDMPSGRSRSDPAPATSP